MSKPVAYRFKSPLSEEGQWEYGKEPPVGSRWAIEPLYTIPPQRKPLTEEEIMGLCAAQWASHPVEVARAVERAHGIGE